MHKKVFLILCSIILLGTIISCGGDHHHGPPPPYGPGDLTLYNDTSLPISELYLTPAIQPDWGPNQLISPLPSGSSYTITGITPDIYDVKATIIGALSIYYGYIYDIPIVALQTYLLYAYNSDFSGSLEIVNDTLGAYIVAIYLSPAGFNSWGPNQITAIVGPGNSIHLYDIPPDSYDVWIIWNTGPDSFYSISVISLTLSTLPVI